MQKQTKKPTLLDLLVEFRNSGVQRAQFSAFSKGKNLEAGTNIPLSATLRIQNNIVQVLNGHFLLYSLDGNKLTSHRV